MFTTSLCWSLPKSTVEMSKPNLAKLRALFLVNYRQEKDREVLKNETLMLGAKSAEVLLEVMKKPIFPDTNRWTATFLLTRLTGKAAAPVLSKFLKHQNWMMRLAALKCLTLIKAKEHLNASSNLLWDPSLLVSKQMLLTISKLKLTKASDDIVTLIKNVATHELSKNDKAFLESAVLTLGALKHEPAKPLLSSLMLSDHYKEISFAVDYSLEKITGKKSPNGDLVAKRDFWKMQAL
jgi:HEAT repeat protein